jgi:hypothetical protein
MNACQLLQNEQPTRSRNQLKDCPIEKVYLNSNLFFVVGWLALTLNDEEEASVNWSRAYELPHCVHHPELPSTQ